MTDVRTFRANNMQEAFQIVRQELGSDAVILNTRQVAERRLIPWFGQKKQVEITAGVGVPLESLGQEESTTTAVIDEMPSVELSYDEPTLEQSWTPPEPTIDETPIEPKTFQEPAPATSSPKLAPYGAKAFAEMQRRATDGSPDEKPEEVDTEVDAEAEKPLPQVTRDMAGTQAEALNASIHSVLENAAATPNSQFADQLNSIQKMLENLARTRSKSVSEEIPNELFHLFTELIDADVEDDLARDLIFRLRENCTSSHLSEASAAKSLLTAMVESEVRVGSPITLQRAARKVVALVGPTGVGKTTTIAKLAANFRLRDGIKMGLVTVDTYRIAAVEQLRTYAEIIDLPMKVVTNPLEMRRAIDELSGLDLVLIDTAGRSPRDELQIQELKSLLAEADVDEVHLVLSMTSSIRSIQATAEKFEAANTTSLILTKLDETAGMGGLLSVSRHVPLPISYLTTGQDVPDDIEPSNASRIARLILGEDRLFE
ncbi:MAG: flagellar biosynthesis protein FlhF [Planctomycetaceae bacterium]|nr:flagellar biosynthesis protein FlhF [Planctomycetaceae bacterium]